MTRVGAAVLLFLMLGVGRGVWQARPAAQASSHDVSPATAILEPNAELMRDHDFAAPRVDLFGNEIDDAVGDYRVDRTGDIYERHSPDTEVAKLRPPIG
jgi:hypothetical protein